MVKAVIFDCFGVLATDAWLPFKAKHFGRDQKLTRQVSDISNQADKGLVSRDAAIASIAELAGISPTEFIRTIDINVPNEELFDLIRTLKPDYKIGFLSNISDDYLAQIFTPKHLSLFDAITLSFKSGFIKPQTQAFERAAEQLDVKPAECVMVDDQERNVTGAREAGMAAILYRDFSQFKAEFESLVKV